MDAPSVVASARYVLRNRYEKPKFEPDVTVVDVSSDSYSSSSTPEYGSSASVTSDEEPDLARLEKEDWTIREVVTNEDGDSLFIPRWKTWLVAIWGSTSILSPFLGIWGAKIVWDILSQLMREGSSTYRLMFALCFFHLDMFTLLHNSFWTFLHVLGLWMPWRRSLRLVGDNVPVIDVVICCCKEPQDVLQDTILATLAVDYPSDRFRVLVADDGASHELRQWVESLQNDRLYYITRPKPARPDYKAGNLNNAIAFMRTLPGGPAAYIASLDADMIPEKRWLRSVLPHMLSDPKLGVTCPSQSFYHTPRNDLLCQDGRSGWNFESIQRDLGTCAACTGSGFIVRREAILDIGGFPASLLEDTFSSTMMLYKGWHTAYLSEAVQYGLVPGSFMASIKQFTRWQIGGAELTLHFKWFLRKRDCGELTYLQRLCAFAIGWSTIITPYVMTLDMLLFPLGLLIGPPLIFKDLHTTVFLVRFQCIGYLWSWFSRQYRAVVGRFNAGHKTNTLNTYMAPFYVYGLSRSFLLPKWLGGTDLPGFTPSGSIANTVHERDASKRAPLSVRARHMLFECGAIFHLIIVAMTLSALAYVIYNTCAQASPETLAYELLKNVGWAVMPASQTVLALAVPLQYMLFPPNLGSRKKIMTKIDADGARYPNHVSRDDNSKSFWHLGLVEANNFMLIYNCFLLAATYRL